jgi:hypothetical protein
MGIKMKLRRQLMRERFRQQMAEAAKKAKLFFMVQEIRDGIPVSFSIESCVAADLDYMHREYEFVRMGGTENGQVINMPVLKRRKRKLCQTVNDVV